MVARRPRSEAEAVTAYLAALPEPQQAALRHLRDIVRAEVPEAEECMAYGAPALRWHGLLVGYAAFKAHLSFFPMNGSLVETFAAELRDFRTARGTIRFTPDRPLPDDLLRRMVTVRKVENAAR